jgi:hypothetical protein
MSPTNICEAPWKDTECVQAHLDGVRVPSSRIKALAGNEAEENWPSAGIKARPHSFPIWSNT